MTAGCRKTHHPNVAPAASDAASAASIAPADTRDLVPLSEWTTQIVTARNVVRLGEIAGATDHFNLDGKIFVHATLSAKPGAHAGSHAFEVKWFDGLNVVTEQKAVYDVKGSPFYIAASSSGVALGAGAHRVELFADGSYLASTQFVVDGR